MNKRASGAELALARPAGEDKPDLDAADVTLGYLRELLEATRKMVRRDAACAGIDYDMCTLVAQLCARGVTLCGDIETALFGKPSGPLREEAEEETP